METTTFERIQSKSLEIVDNDGNPRVEITADETGGRMSAFKARVWKLWIMTGTQESRLPQTRRVDG